LAKEIVAHNPYEANIGAVGPTWDRVADAVGFGVDGRRCRERVKLLVKNRKQRVAAFDRASGLEELVSSLDAFVDEITVLKETTHAT
jgi:hypothetical protein